MDFGDIGKVPEVPENRDENGNMQFKKEALDKFDRLMGDDSISGKELGKEEKVHRLTDSERESKFDKLFDIGNFFQKREVESSVEDDYSDKKQNMEDEIKNGTEQTPDILQIREPNSEYELDGDVYETDDNGKTYKKNGELLPDIEYTVKGNTYKTDEQGRKSECDSEPFYTEEGSRNMKEQKEAGGEERKEEDDGGHLIAKILGGAEGDENLVPMRRTINRGDYKRMENEIAKALQEGKAVTIHIDLKYDGDSQRPSKIRVEYIIDGKKTIVEFDNEENSTELLDSLNEKISDEDYNNLKAEIEDMNADGVDASVTSVKTEYDENGNSTKVTVGVLDESTGKKTYKVYESR